MTKSDWQAVLHIAIKNKLSMQNMTDNTKACKFATKRGYKLANNQGLPLLTWHQNIPVIIFIFRLHNGNDIAVFMPGQIVYGKYGGMYLKTKPVNIVEINYEQ
jgi:hypothetical protein